MKVLLVSSGWLTHLLPMTPLARALRAAGHETWLAVPPALLGPAAATGLPVRLVGRDVAYEPVFAGVLRAPRPVAPAARPPGRPRVLRLFAEAAAKMLPDLGTQLRVGRFDAVVYEPMALAAPVAAALAGVPAVRFRFGPDALDRHLDGLFEEFVEACARFGVAYRSTLAAAARRGGRSGAALLAGTRTVDPTPRALRPDDDDTGRWPVRYVPAWPGAGRPPRTVPPPAGPVVAVTWGSTLFRCAPAAYAAGPVARALAGVAGTLLVLTRDGQDAALGDLPPHATVLRDVPVQAVAGDCDLVVSHGGAGTVLTTALAGTPHLAVPRLPDHRFHAGRLADSGAGRSVPLTDPVDTAVPGPAELSTADAAAVTGAAAGLLADTAARRAAAALAADMAAAPGPAEVADRLAGLAALTAGRAA